MEERLSVFYLSVFMTFVSQGEGHKILLFPFGFKFNSHVLDAIRISEILVSAGHETHFLISDSSLATVAKTGLPVHVYRAGAALPGELTDEVRALYLNASDAGAVRLLTFMKDVSDGDCENLLGDADLLKDIRQEEFDLVIVDIAVFCYSLFVNKVGLTSAAYSPIGVTGYDYFPFYTSFMPSPTSGFPARMTFTQRLQNTAEHLLVGKLILHYVFSHLYHLADKHGTIADPFIMQKQIFFLRSHPIMDGPFPRMPSVVEIGGALVKPASPLPPDLEEWVKGAGDAGVVVVSLGTLVSDIPDQRADMMSRVFSSLPQRVVWKQRHRPVGMGDNVLLTDWIPQNDLLGDPRTRLFITHCGMSSTFEAVYHAVPVVTIPLLGDQFRNSMKLVARMKMGVRVDFHGMTEEGMGAAVRGVLSDPGYARNAQAASRALLDQPMPPRERFLYYVDLIVRTGGAGHLIEERLRELNWAQLNSVDTIACLGVILLAVLTVLCIIIYVALKLVFRLFKLIFAPKKAKSD